MSMSEWQKYKLGEVCTKIGSGATPKGGKESYLGGNISLIRKILLTLTAGDIPRGQVKR